MNLLNWPGPRQPPRVPDSPTTIAVGTAWLGLIVSLSLTVQALVQVDGPKSLSAAASCPFPIEVFQNDVSRFECHGQTLTSLCAGLEPGDRAAFNQEKCVVEKDSMSGAMRLVASLPMDVNRVTATDLTLLKGIGPHLSRAIVDHRDQRGRFTSVDDLIKVRGIGKKRLSGLRKYLTCATP